LMKRQLRSRRSRWLGTRNRPKLNKQNKSNVVILYSACVFTKTNY
jgi:hypothetical protein